MMKSAFIAKGAALASAALAALALASCATAPPPEPVAVIAPPPPPPPPPIALSSRVMEQAAHFRSYMRKAGAVSPAFTGGDDVERALQLAAQYEPKELSRAVIAYAAVIALQDPQFVAGVQTLTVNPETRKAVAARLLADPSYVAALPGVQGAAGLVVATLNEDGGRVRGLGQRVKQAAYDVQHQKWSKLPVPNPAIRLAQAKSISAMPMTSTPEETAAFARAVPNGEGGVSPISPVPGGPIAGPYTPLVARGLSLAALAILGEAGDANDANAEALLTEETGGSCLNMSKLNLYQCLSVAKPYYEDVFCLGQHVLIDTGQCIAKGAGPSAPAQVSRPVSLANGAAAGLQPSPAAAPAGVPR